MAFELDIVSKAIAVAGFVGSKVVAITRLRIGMNRFEKLVQAAATTVIILTVGSATAVEAEFKVNPQNLPLCSAPDYSKNTDNSRIAHWHNCWGKYKLEFVKDNIGDIYECEWRNGLPNGKGMYYQNNGDKYIGELTDGEPHGIGSTTFSSGNIHKGEYKKGQPNGWGEYYAQANNQYKGDRYFGQFNDGQRHGQGIYVSSNGKRMEGIWERHNFVRESNVNLADMNNIIVANTDSADINHERLQVADEHRNTDQVKIKREKPSQNQKINLEVTNTQPNAEGEFTVSIKTNSDTASLKINGDEQGGKEDGFYTIKRIARAGQVTQLIVFAEDVYGNIDTKTISVNRKISSSSQVRYAELNPAQIKSQPSRDAVAIIIGIADYKNLPRADYANDDARAFYDYAIRGLGVKAENIKLLVDADAGQGEIYKAFKTWLPIRVKATTDVYVYYSGHGLPANDGQSLYLLPQLADRDLIEETAIAQNKINAVIKAAKPKSVTIFLDSCYSGAGRSGQTLLASARPIAIKSTVQAFPAEFTVISASTAEQISSSSNELKHGIFSYYLMKGMEGDADINKDGKITAGEMHTYLTENVAKQASLVNRVQQPQLTGDANKVLVGK
jgi:hypothetical protein